MKKVVICLIVVMILLNIGTIGIFKYKESKKEEIILDGMWKFEVVGDDENEERHYFNFDCGCSNICIGFT